MTKTQTAPAQLYNNKPVWMCDGEDHWKEKIQVLSF